jgi:hypothetical protein
MTGPRLITQSCGRVCYLTSIRDVVTQPYESSRSGPAQRDKHGRTGMSQGTAITLIIVILFNCNIDSHISDHTV